MMKRLMAILLSMTLAASMLVSVYGTQAAGAFTPGTFTATVEAHEGPLTVEVVFTADRIESVTVVEHVEFASFAIVPFERIPAQIVEYQSLDIDTIAGATITSMALLFAVTQIVMEAGGDLTALRARRPRPAANAPVTIETDVVVVGSGIAGVSAAIEAAYAGADVLVIEKMGLFGGTSATSQGWIQGANNAVMQANNIEDSIEEFEEFLNIMAWHRADPEMINHIAHLSGNTIDWLIDMGVVFRDTPQYSFLGYSPSRAVRVLDGRGCELMIPMVEFAKSLGAEFMMETPGVSLIMDNGAVIGVNAVDITGGPVTIYADNVILATGGFQRDNELLHKFMPLHVASGTYIVGGIVGAAGDGHRWGIEAGAAIVKGYLGINALAGVPHRGVWITPSGHRFTDEGYYYNHARTSALLDLGYNYQFTIMDANHLDAALEAALEAGMAFQADTLEELAELIDIDPAVLVATIERYNELAELGEDLDHGSVFSYDPDRLVPIVDAPFFAQISNQFSLIWRTGGGLEIDLYGRVIHENGGPIPGLFAVGEVATAQYLPVEYGGSGMALTTYANMARLAGRVAAGGDFSDLRP